MRYSLRQLEVFLAIARSRSVRRAARELGMSQSAASASLGDLERQFDVRLFDRVGKRLILSELGHSLRPQAEALDAMAREFETRLAGQDAVGSLRVGATLSIGNYLTAPLLARFLERHPQAQVTLHIANTTEIARMVSNFELDVGLIEGELEHPALQMERFRQDELAVFCAPQHPLAHARTLTDRHLISADWIVREPGSGTRQAFEHAMHGILPDLRIRLELQHTEAIKSAVKAGLGVGCVSSIALKDEFAAGSLVRCRIGKRDLRRYFYLVLRRDKHHSSTLRHWLELARRSES